MRAVLAALAVGFGMAMAMPAGVAQGDPPTNCAGLTDPAALQLCGDLNAQKTHTCTVGFLSWCHPCSYYDHSLKVPGDLNKPPDQQAPLPNPAGTPCDPNPDVQGN
jgi:hypothetical protein